jgi:hypothetical protein
MGFQTTIIIRNDAIGDIQRNPAQFVDGLLHAINEVSAGDTKGWDVPCGNHANVARVIEVHHSDSTTIVASGGSTAELLATIHEWRWGSIEEKMRAIIMALTDSWAIAKKKGIA